MTSPIELLKSGLTDGNWAAVAESYRMLTGERVGVPVVASISVTVDEAALRQVVEEASKVMRAHIHGELDRLFGGHDFVPASPLVRKPDPDFIEVPPAPPKANPKRNRVKKPARTAPPASPPPPPPDEGQFEHTLFPTAADDQPANAFVDDGSLAPEELASTEQLCRIAKRSARRPPSRLVDAVCGVLSASG